MDDKCPKSGEADMNGYKRLLELIEYIKTTGADMSVYEYWEEHYRPGIVADLDDWCREAQREFINRYAGFLVQALSALLSVGALEQAADAAMDFMEELHGQAKDVKEKKDG